MPNPPLRLRNSPVDVRRLLQLLASDSRALHALAARKIHKVKLAGKLAGPNLLYRVTHKAWFYKGRLFSHNHTTKRILPHNALHLAHLPLPAMLLQSSLPTLQQYLGF